MRKRKTTPEERARIERAMRWSEEDGKRVWQYLERAWDELEERAAREGRPLKVGRPEKPVWG